MKKSKVITHPSRKIPTYIADEHNLAFYFWHKAKADGYLEEAIDLFHVDAHPDMMFPQTLKNSLYCSKKHKNDYLKYYRNIAKNCLHIGNFILPAVLNDIIKNVYYIYPDWKLDFKFKRSQAAICSMFGEGKQLRCSLNTKEDYFDNIKKALKVFPDLKHFNYYHTPLEKIPKNRKSILDIDLDFFACKDYFYYDLEVNKSQFSKREKLLKDPTIIVGSIKFKFRKKGSKYFVRVSHERAKTPTHIPTKKEIKDKINKFKKHLTIKRVRPAVITISRSKSGYCPKERCKFIENELLEALRQLYDISLIDQGKALKIKASK